MGNATIVFEQNVDAVGGQLTIYCGGGSFVLLVGNTLSDNQAVISGSDTPLAGNGLLSGSGAAEDPWLVEFVGSLANTAVAPLLGYDASELVAELYGNQDEIQALLLSPTGGNTGGITLTLPGYSATSELGLPLSGGAIDAAIASATTGAVTTTTGEDTGNGVWSLSLIAGGSGYTSAPAVLFDVDSGGSGAAATVAPFFPVASVTLTAEGLVYDLTAITVTGGGGSGATVSWTAVMDRLYNVIVTSGGSSYTKAPTVSVTGGGGTGATATAVVSGGHVIGVGVSSVGSGYTSTPSLVFDNTGSGGTGAAATAQMFSKVTSVTLTNGGGGYTSAPTATLTYAVSDPSPTMTFALPGSIALTSDMLTLVSSGSGYTTAPAVSFSGGGGSGATATTMLAGQTWLIEYTGGSADLPFGLFTVDDTTYTPQDLEPSVYTLSPAANTDNLLANTPPTGGTLYFDVLPAGGATPAYNGALSLSGYAESGGTGDFASNVAGAGTMIFTNDTPGSGQTQPTINLDGLTMAWPYIGPLKISDGSPGIDFTDGVDPLDGSPPNLALTYSGACDGGTFAMDGVNWSITGGNGPSANWTYSSGSFGPSGGTINFAGTSNEAGSDPVASLSVVDLTYSATPAGGTLSDSFTPGADPLDGSPPLLSVTYSGVCDGGTFAMDGVNWSITGGNGPSANWTYSSGSFGPSGGTINFTGTSNEAGSDPVASLSVVDLTYSATSAGGTLSDSFTPGSFATLAVTYSSEADGGTWSMDGTTWGFDGSGGPSENWAYSGGSFDGSPSTINFIATTSTAGDPSGSPSDDGLSFEGSPLGGSLSDSFTAGSLATLAVTYSGPATVGTFAMDGTNWSIIGGGGPSANWTYTSGGLTPGSGGTFNFTANAVGPGSDPSGTLSTSGLTYAGPAGGTIADSLTPGAAPYAGAGALLSVTYSGPATAGTWAMDGVNWSITGGNGPSANWAYSDGSFAPGSGGTINFYALADGVGSDPSGTLSTSGLTYATPAGGSLSDSFTAGASPVTGQAATAGFKIASNSPLVAGNAPDGGTWTLDGTYTAAPGDTSFGGGFWDFSSGSLATCVSDPLVALSFAYATTGSGVGDPNGTYNFSDLTISSAGVSGGLWLPGDTWADGTNTAIVGAAYELQAGSAGSTQVIVTETLDTAGGSGGSGAQGRGILTGGGM